jgi:pyruvate ferredoxin oxidoreductase beta subunit
MKDVKTIFDISEEELFTGGHPACKGCGGALIAKLVTKALGKDIIVVNASGCMTLLNVFPLTPFKVPWIHNAIENAGATASGILRALKRLGKKTKVVCYAGDGATYDIGFQSLSAMVERKENVLYVCYNNQSFANTGIQKSGATPYGAWTTTTPTGRKEHVGKGSWKKPLPRILAAHGTPYVATATVGFPVDLIIKMQKAAKIKGPTYIDVFSPCPPGWGYHSSQSIHVSRLAVSSGAWPLYEIEKGKFNLTFKIKNKSVKEYLSLQKRFKHLKENEIKKIQKHIDEQWSLLSEGKFWEVE